MNDDLINIMQQLQICTMDYPIQQIIGELTIVIERLGFAQLDGSKITSVNEKDSVLGFLLGSDVSPGILAFTEYLAHEGKMGLLLDEAGEMFIGYCKAYFSEIKQLEFKTAVALSDEGRRHITVMLLRLYPVSTRIVFVVDPSVVAGFILHESGNEICDYSLRKNASRYLDTYIRKALAVA